MSSFKNRIWVDPETNELSSFTKISVHPACLSFWKRLVYAFWYVVKPNSEDLFTMATVRIEEAPPPPGKNLVCGVKMLPPNYEYNIDA